MTRDAARSEVLKLVDGIRFAAGPDEWMLAPLKVAKGDWIALAPDDPEVVYSPAGPLAWILATMEEPLRGAVELLGRDVYRLEYGAVQRLRARIGFVHGYGGLLSARTVRENVALPVSVHGRLGSAEEAERVDRMIRLLELESVSELHPHEMDGFTRWRACLARALILEPDWLVLEGIGSWEMDRGRGRGWELLLQLQERGALAAAICLARTSPEFESWFQDHRGTIMRYKKCTDRYVETGLP